MGYTIFRQTQVNPVPYFITFFASQSFWRPMTASKIILLWLLFIVKSLGCVSSTTPRLTSGSCPPLSTMLMNMLSTCYSSIIQWLSHQISSLKGALGFDSWLGPQRATSSRHHFRAPAERLALLVLSKVMLSWTIPCTRQGTGWYELIWDECRCQFQQDTSKLISDSFQNSRKHEATQQICIDLQYPELLENTCENVVRLFQL